MVLKTQCAHKAIFALDIIVGSIVKCKINCARDTKIPVPVQQVSHPW